MMLADKTNHSIVAGELEKNVIYGDFVRIRPTSICARQRIDPSTISQSAHSD